MSVTRLPHVAVPATLLAFVALAGLVAGVAPLLALSLGFVVAVTMLLVRSPTTMVFALVASHSVRWGDLGIPGGGSIFFLQKVLWLLVLVRLVAARPRNLAVGIAPLTVLVLMSLWTWAFSLRLPGLSAAQTVQSLATLALPWLAASVVLDSAVRDRLLRLMQWVPSLSVVLGLGLVGVGARASLYSLDFNSGTQRLGGATIPAYLAALAMVAVVAGGVQVSEGDRLSRYLLTVNILILLLTAGRGAILCALIASIPAIRRVVFRRSISLSGIGARVAGGLLLAVIGLIAFVPTIVARTETGGTLNTSGREQAWRYFLGLAKTDPIFGRGLGSGPIASAQALKGVLSDTFVAQHSEYVRLILEGGYLGLILFVISVVLSLRVLTRRARHRQLMGFVVFLGIGIGLYSFTDNTFTDFQLGTQTGLLFACMAASPAARHRVTPGLAQPTAMTA